MSRLTDFTPIGVHAPTLPPRHAWTSDNGHYVTKLAINLPVVSLRLLSFSLAGLDYGVGHLV
jgi:hypothetical protein